MDAIATFLAQPLDERSYTEGLRLLEAHGGFAYAADYAKLAKGPMGGNRHRLFLLLRQLPRQAEKVQAAHIEVHATQPDLLTPNSPNEISALMALRKAKQDRAKCSQQFHTCHTDAERAEVCALIERATERIRKLQGELARLQQGIKPAEEAEEEELALPDDEEALAAENARIGSRKAKVERRVLHVLALPETDRNRKKLPAYEEQLRKMNARQQAIRIKLRAMRLAKEQESNETTD